MDQISGAKRKQNLIDHAEDARVSKALATAIDGIETGVELGSVLAAEPDRGALREFMREFELRAVMERLEEALPEGEAVPGRNIERELELETVPGDLEDLPPGPLAIAIEGESWAAAGERLVVAGRSSLAELAAALAGRALMVHDAKYLGGGRHGLLAAAASAGLELELRHDTMLAAYLLDRRGAAMSSPSPGCRRWHRLRQLRTRLERPSPRASWR